MGGPVPGPTGKSEEAWMLAALSVVAGVAALVFVGMFWWLLWSEFGFKGPLIAAVVVLCLVLATAEIQRRIIPHI